MSEFDDYESGQSESAEAVPRQCSALRKNECVLIKGQPCKIVEMSTSKTGKHGHAKVHLVGIHIFTEKKYEDVCPSTHNMMVPITKRQEYQVNDLDGDFLSLMNDKGEVRCDLKLPEGALGKEIRVRFEKDEPLLVSVLSAMGEERVMAVKLDTAIQP